MSYKEQLEGSKQYYPFEKWKTMFFPDEEAGTEGMEQYTEENCNAAQAICDTLISQLNKLGEKAVREDKEALFKTAVEAFNKLNEDADECLIETGEREELCELFDHISMAAGLSPADYSDGEGIASEWREW